MADTEIEIVEPKEVLELAPEQAVEPEATETEQEPEAKSEFDGLTAIQKIAKLEAANIELKAKLEATEKENASLANQIEHDATAIETLMNENKELKAKGIEMEKIVEANATEIKKLKSIASCKEFSDLTEGESGVALDSGIAGTGKTVLQQYK